MMVDFASRMVMAEAWLFGVERIDKAVGGTAATTRGLRSMSAGTDGGTGEGGAEVGALGSLMWRTQNPNIQPQFKNLISVKKVGIKPNHT